MADCRPISYRSCHEKNTCAVKRQADVLRRQCSFTSLRSMKLQASPSLNRGLSFAEPSLISPRLTKATGNFVPANLNHIRLLPPKREVIACIIAPPQEISGVLGENVSRNPDERQALFVSSSIKVNTPVELVYEQWLKFGVLPHFMCGAVRGARHGESRMVWRIGWTEGYSQWEAEVCEQIPCARIAWSNEHGRPCAHSGSVCFHPVSESVTRITVSLEFASENPLGKTAFAVEILASRVEHHLKCFQACGAAQN